MEPNHPNEDLFRIFLHDYLMKRGFIDTAEFFRNEVPITVQIPEFDHEPDDFLRDFWNLLYDKYTSRKQMPGSCSQSQVIVQPSPTSADSLQYLSRRFLIYPNVGAVMNRIPQIIRDRYSFQQVRSFQSGQTLLSCDFSSGGNWVASGGRGNKPFICNIKTGYHGTTSESHLSTILEVRFQPGTNKFATSSTDKTVKLWDVNNPEPEKALFRFAAGDNKVVTLDFDPSGRNICFSETDGELMVWDLHQEVMISSLKAGGSLVRFQPGCGKFLAVVKKNVITIIDWHAPRVFKNLQGHVKDINSICWDITGEMIASTSEDDVRVWSVFDGGQCIHEYPSDGRRFQSVVFHPRYHSVLVIGGYQCLELRILENGGKRFSLRASEVSVTGLAATTTQSEYIASASNDSVVKIWK